ncbi:hypothetical protein ACFFRR_006628 [Megaselia abdita]
MNEQAMKNSKKKIYRKSSDFYTQKDLFETKIVYNPVTINDFNAKGEIINPKAPCVATNIDPSYFLDASIRLPVRKFLVKTDTMKIRNIMRTKFFMYTNEQRAIEKAKEYEKHKNVYENVMNFYKFCFRRLNAAKLRSFTEMKVSFEVLENLQNNTLEDDLKELEMNHQRVYIEVLELFNRFRFLLGLIDYFDNFTKEGENILKLNELMKTEYSDFLETLPSAHTHNNIKKFQNLIEELIFPYLNQQNYLDVQIWQTGYENIRRKMFNYSRHLSRVALLTHIVSIVSDKFLKTNKFIKGTRVFRKDPDIIHARTTHIQKVALTSLGMWEENQQKNDEMIEVNGVVPVLLRKLKIDEDKEDPTVDRKSTVLQKIGEIHEVVINILHKFDNVEAKKLTKLEALVRVEMEKKKADSRKALIKEIRLKNLLKHYKDHFKKKNIVSGYITNLPRPRGKIYPLKNES